jgi:hypothetical protein
LNIPDFANLREQAELVWLVARSPAVEIALFGNEEARTAYRAFTGRHKRLPLLPSKTFGAALLRIPASPEQLLAGTSSRNLRQRRKRAIDRGYRFTEIDGPAHTDRILAINRSADRRQGRPLTDSYTDIARVRRYCSNRRPFFGIFDRNDVLRAYCHTPVLGDVFSFARILGEQDRLRDGIMYLLVAEVIVTMRAQRELLGYPQWAMYDMYIGGGRGLRIFKKECGFRPYRVIWRWNEEQSYAVG